MRAPKAVTPNQTPELSPEKFEVYMHFKRYFGLVPAGRRGYGSLFSGMKGFNKGRDEVSEILPERLFLSNIEGIGKRINALQGANPDNDFLVVSCMDFNESLPTSRKHFWLAMEDGTGKVDHVERIVDALVLMKNYYDQGKPILVHCREGVGRSVMLTYSFLSYLYLCQEATVQAVFQDADNPSLEQVVNFAFAHVYKARSCSQFDDKKTIVSRLWR